MQHLTSRATALPLAITALIRVVDTALTARPALTPIHHAICATILSVSTVQAMATEHALLGNAVARIVLAKTTQPLTSVTVLLVLLELIRSRSVHWNVLPIAKPVAMGFVLPVQLVLSIISMILVSTSAWELSPRDTPVPML